MAYEKLKLGVSPLTNTVFAGRVNKEGNMWIDKVDVTEQFLSCCCDYFEKNTKNTISADGEPVFTITVEEIKKEI